MLTMAFLDGDAIDVATATTTDYHFPTLSSSAAPFLTSTVIPARKGDMTIDGPLIRSPFYKDVHVLHLSAGAGWLMVAARYGSMTEVFGPGGSATEPPGPYTSTSAVVGFWAPEADGGFQSNDVRGPVFLVSRVIEVDGSPSLVWLGVPAAVEKTDGVTSTIFLYYTAEQTTYLPPAAAVTILPEKPDETWRAGTRLRIIYTAQILAAMGVSQRGEGSADASAATNSCPVKTP